MRLESSKNQPRAKTKKTKTSMEFVLPLGGLILPFFVWIIEIVFPYPYIIEELGKTIFVVIAWQIPRQITQIKVTALMAFFFAFSESIFYLFRLSFNGTLQIFFLRLLLTTLLHTTTSLLILLPTLKNKKFILVSLPLAVGVHYLYNYFVLFLNLSP